MASVDTTSGKPSLRMHLAHAIRFLPRHLLRCLRFAGQPVSIHRTCSIRPTSILRVFPRGKGSIHIGRNGWIEDFVKITTFCARICIGDDCSINDFTIIRGGGNITIGNNTRIAPHCCIVACGHTFDSPDTPIRLQPLSNLPITIESDVWIGSNTTILPGVTIGRGSVIGAGSVVTHSIPPYAVAVGNPARVIRTRGENNGTTPLPVEHAATPS